MTIIDSLTRRLGDQQLFRRHAPWIHPQNFPVMSIEVVEAPPIHEAVVLRSHGIFRPGGPGLVHQLIDLGTTVLLKREQAFRLSARVADSPPGKRLEKWFGKEHYERLVADDHACRICVCESRIELKSQAAEEILRVRQVFDSQIYEYLAGTSRHHFQSP